MYSFLFSFGEEDHNSLFFIRPFAEQVVRAVAMSDVVQEFNHRVCSPSQGRQHLLWGTTWRQQVGEDIIRYQVLMIPHPVAAFAQETGLRRRNFTRSSCGLGINCHMHQLTQYLDDWK